MGLLKKVVPISLVEGVDGKADYKQIIMGKLIYLQNAFFNVIGTLSKRYGFTALTQSTYPSGTITNGVGAATFKNELLELDGTYLYSYSPNDTKMINKGYCSNIRLSATAVVRNSYQQNTPDSCINSGYQLFAWEDSQGGVWYNIFDTITSQEIIGPVQLSAYGSLPKCVALGTYVVIIYEDTNLGGLSYGAISVSAITTAPTPTLIASDISASLPNYDVTIINGSAYVAYNKASQIGLRTISSSLSISGVTNISDVASSCIGVFGDPSNNLWIGYYNGTNVKFAVYSSALSVVTAPTILGTESAVSKIAGVYNSNSSLGYFYYEISSTVNYNYLTKLVTTNVGGSSIVGPNVFCRSVGMASKPFYYLSSVYILLTYASTLQPTYFLFNQNGNVGAKISPNSGGGSYSKSVVPQVNQISTGVFQVTYLQQDFVTALNGNVYFQLGVMQSNLDFTQTGINYVEIGANALLPGAIVQCYDGASVTEQGFNIYPETPTTAVLPVGGALSLGSYEYSSVYEASDNQGQVNRSAPSVGVIQVLQNTETTFLGSVNSGSNSISVNGYSTNHGTGTFNLDALYLGMLIGPSTIFPAGTTITAVTPNSSPNLGTFIITTSANATANGTAFVAQPQLTFSPSTTFGSKQMTVFDPFQMVVYGQKLYNSSMTYLNQMIIPNPIGLAPGMQLTNPFYFYGGSPTSFTITSISGTTVNTSGSSGINFTYLSTYTAFVATASFTANSSGGTTLTSVPTSAFGFLTVGSMIVNGSNTEIGQIVSLNSSAQTITLNSSVGSATGVTYYQTFPCPDVYLPGMQVVGAGLTSFATIKTVTEVYAAGLSNGAAIITLDQPVEVSSQSNTYTIANTYGVAVTQPTLRVTARKNSNIVLYRTQSNGTLFYRTSSVSSLVYNSTSVDTLPIFDGTADAVLIGNEQLYTNSGEVENISPPASNILLSYRSRPFLIPVENPITYQYGKQIISGTPPEFSSELFYGGIDQKGGVISAAAVMDTYVIFFKPYNIFYMTGEGPAPNGTNNDFTEPQLISTDTGCSNQKSIVLTPIGLIFQSPKGYYLLSRDLAVEYIGAEVEKYNAYTCTSALLMVSLNQVRFTLSNGTALVYDYFVKQWSIFTNIAAIDAVNFQGNMTYLTSGGQFLQETPGIYTDNGAFIPMSLTTSWLSFAGLQGYQRVYKLLILGDYYSPHTLTVTASTNFKTGVIDDTSTIPVLSQPTVYQYRIFTAKQKCQSIQFTITETQTSPYGQGLDLSNLAFEVGVKEGPMRLPASQSFT